MYCSNVQSIQTNKQIQAIGETTCTSTNEINICIPIPRYQITYLLPYFVIAVCSTQTKGHYPRLNPTTYPNPTINAFIPLSISSPRSFHYHLPSFHFQSSPPLLSAIAPHPGTKSSISPHASNIS